MKTFRRCTEIPDKTGKNIYEGDIVRVSSFDGLEVNTFTFVVKFGRYQDSDSQSRDIAVGFYLENPDDGKRYHFIKDTDDVMEIIGNIYNNPESSASMKRALYRGKGYEGNNEIWVYGYYVNVCNTPTIVVPDTAEEVVVDLNSVGQFTGLYDRTQWNELSMNEQREWFAMNDSDEWHGRPIFEGDIIKTEDFIAVVKFGEYNDCAIGFYLKCYIGLNNLLENANVNISKEYKVIGNVYDNPELITN